MTLAGRLDARKGMRENKRICEISAKRALLIALTAFFTNVSIIYYSALLRNGLLQFMHSDVKNNIYGNELFIELLRRGEC